LIWGDAKAIAAAELECLLMYRYVLAAGVLLAAPCAAFAQSAPVEPPGFSAGDVVVRLAINDITPLVGSSHIDGIGGHVDVTSASQPELDLSYFATDNISLQLIATATRHEISANDTSLTPLLGSKIDLASTYVLPPAVVAQYHFFPHAIISPYVGAGIDFLWPFDTQENKAALGGTQIVQKVGLSNAIGPVFDLGADYNISGPWFLNVDYKQVLDQVDARVHTALGLVKARVQLDPAVLSIGIAYRF
jgi:outer membrane protein